MSSKSEINAPLGTILPTLGQDPLKAAPWSEVVAKASSITLKIGSALIVDAKSKRTHSAWMHAFALDVAALKSAGKAVMIVSSGAVGLGRAYLGLKAGKLSLNQKQAAAAAGQPLLMRHWEDAFAPLGIKVAQVLLTREDTEKRKRWLNARDTIDTLLKSGVVPIVNENDTLATEEIRYGDNDRLAARSAMLMRADLLVLLSDVDGLYTADPRRSPKAQHLAVIDQITPEIEAMAGGANQEAGVGTGGMSTKIMAAKIAGAAGCATVIAQGQGLRPLEALQKGQRSTLILAPTQVQAAYKAWIAGTVAPKGLLIIDQGAVAALRRGKSLLPTGIIGLEGVFDKGDSLVIADETKTPIARGIVAYGQEDIALIMGKASTEIEGLLGYRTGDEVIHRDDLVMM